MEVILPRSSSSSYKIDSNNNNNSNSSITPKHPKGIPYDPELVTEPFLDMPSIKPFVEKIKIQLKAANYGEVLNDLSMLFMDYNEREQVSAKDTRIIFNFVKQLIPFLGFESLNRLVSKIKRFLEKTAAFPEEQLAVANLIGTKYLKEKKNKMAMHYFAKAFVIAKSHNLPTEDSLTSPIFYSYISQEKIKQIFDKAVSNGPQAFDAQLKRVDQLKAFCQLHDQSFIYSLYQQAQEKILNVGEHREKHFSQFSSTIIRGLTQPLVTPETLPVQKYRKALEEFRTRFKERHNAQQDINDPQAIRQFQKEITQYFHVFFNSFLSDIFVILGEPNYDYDFRAMGSIGREEMCPYSDLEWFVLISDLQFHSDMLSMAELFELQIISLGETSLENPSYFGSVPLKSGLHIDIGGNPARNPSLIDTPLGLAKEQLPSYDQEQFILANDVSSTMRKSSSLASQGNLFEQYEQGFRDGLGNALPQNALPQEGNNTNNNNVEPLFKTVGEQRAIRFLARHLEDFKKVWEGGPPRGSINLKIQYVELINHLMTTLTLFYNLSETNTLDIIDKLTEKEIFTHDSSQLLKKAVAGIYMIRVRLHLLYKEQKEEVNFNDLKLNEQDLLLKTYWLVLKPLYQLVETWVERSKPIAQANFLEIATDKLINDLSLLENKTRLSLDEYKQQFPLQLSGGYHRYSLNLRMSQNFLQEESVRRELLEYKALVGLIASLVESESNPQLRHIEVYNKLSRFFQFESLRRAYLDRMDRCTRDILFEIPNSAGLRQAYFGDYKKFERAFTACTTNQIFPGAVKVTTSFLEKDKIYYLKPEVAEAILEGGKIKREYSNCAHNVAHYEATYCDFYFKGMPSHPMMEYAMHSLTSRIMGKGTPPVHLIRLDTTAGPYPVLVSETIPGQALGVEKGNVSFDLKHLTWMLLCQVITHPGDGRPPNFVVDEKGKIFCVDNDVSLVEPMIYDNLYNKINCFASALFCLTVEKDERQQEVLDIDLCEEVLEVFCSLDVPILLQEWLDDVIEREAKVLNLFNSEEKKHLFKEDSGNFAKFKFFIGQQDQQDQQKLFTPHILFQKGAIASLCAQLVSLQRTISEKLFTKEPITPLDLLHSLTTLGKRAVNQANLGREIGKLYRQVQQLPTLEKRYQRITGRTHSIYLSHSQTVVYGEPLTIKDIEEGEKYSPENAKEELLFAKHIWVGNAKFTQHEQEITLKVDFSTIIKQSGQPDVERQNFVLSGLHYRMRLYKDCKPSQVYITNCYVMNDKDLLPFLHEDLQILNLTGCSNITNQLMGQIEKNCPNLKELYLSGTDIVSFSTFSSIKRTYNSITMLNLQILHLSRCERLDTIKLNAPFLQKLKIESSNNIKIVKFSDLYSISGILNSKATIELKSTAPKIVPYVFKTYERAIKGKVSDQIALAEYFCKGDGVEQSYQKAFFWYQQAQASKHAQDQLRSEAQLRLAELYFNGEGTGKNLSQAIEWSKKASSDLVDARLLLARCYIETIANLDNVTELNLRDCVDLTDSMLAFLTKKCPHIKSLDLSNCDKITDKGLSYLSSLTELESLNLSLCSITDIGLEQLNNLTQLQNLDLSGCNITSEGLSHLNTLEQLKALNLEHCTQITNEGLSCLISFPNLQILSLSNCKQITDVGLACLGNLVELQILNLSNCKQITDAGLFYVAFCVQLKSLDLSCSTQITDNGIVYLKVLTQLQVLNLSGCTEITDEGLLHLKTLTQLKQLGIGDCSRITKKGKDEIKDCIPQLDILTAMYNAALHFIELASFKKLFELPSYQGLFKLKGFFNFKFHKK